MDDILTSIIGIALATILMFIFPLITMTDRADDVSQLTVKVATSEFANDIRQTGKITPERYNQFIQNIGSTGNTYNVEMEVKILDENPARRRVILNGDSGEHGENVYYSVYNYQIEKFFRQDKTYYLKEGDIVTVSVRNTNQTMSQQLKNFLYTVVGKDTYIISASNGGMVTVTGK